jgi:hypothetical protein
MAKRNNNNQLSKEISEILTIEQDAILKGGLLGDSTLQKRGNSYRLRIAQNSQQLDYVEWKYAKLQSLCGTTQKPTARGPDQHGTVMW